MDDFDFEICAEIVFDSGNICSGCQYDSRCGITAMFAKKQFPPRLTDEELAMDDETFRKNNRSLVYGPGGDATKSEFE